MTFPQSQPSERAIPSRVTRRNNFFRFVQRVLDRSSPRGIHYRFGKTVVLDYMGDTHVLEHDQPKLVDQVATELMGEVLVSVYNPLVNTHNHFAPLPYCG